MGAVDDDEEEEERTVMQQAPAWALENEDGPTSPSSPAGQLAPAFGAPQPAPAPVNLPAPAASRDADAPYERTVALEGLSAESGFGPAPDFGNANSDMPRTVALPSGDYPALTPSGGVANPGHDPNVPRTVALDGAAAAAHFSSPNMQAPSGSYPQPAHAHAQAHGQAHAQAEESGGVFKIVLIGAALFMFMAAAAGGAVFLLMR
ncbi:MAG: hypothetical protein SangKO_053290 [Sandaracinaceae bacterium]